MKVYTFTGEGLFQGISKGYSHAEGLAGMSVGLQKKIKLSTEKPPAVHPENPWMIIDAQVQKQGGDLIFEASTVSESEVIVLIKTSSATPTMSGTWDFLTDKKGRVLKKLTTRRSNVEVAPGNKPLTWQEGIVVLKPGQGIKLQDQSGNVRILEMNAEDQLHEHKSS